MINKIYRKVFETDTERFNVQNNNYIVLLNFAKETTIGQDLLSCAQRYIDGTCIKEIPMSCDKISDSLADTLEDHIYERRTHFGDVTASYVMVFDSSENNSAQYVLSAIQEIKDAHILRGEDTLVLLAVVSSEGDVKNEFLKQLEESPFMENVVLNLFIKSRNNERERNKIIENMTGVMYQYSEKASMRSFTDAISKTKSHVDNNVVMLPEEGKKMYESKPSLIWTVPDVTFYDDRINFLRDYLSGRFNKKYIETIDSFDFNKVCTEYYRTMVCGDVEENVQSRVLAAINRIPRVTSHEPNTSNSLRNYFEQLYGYGALDVVDLTIKLNIQNRNSYRSNVIVEAATRVFEAVSNYHSDNIIEQICDKLDRYIKEVIDAEIKERHNKLSEYLGEDTDIDSTHVKNYARMYIGFYDEECRKAFWAEVRNFILTNKELYSKYDERAKDLCKKLEEVSVSVLTGREELRVEYPKYPAGMLINIDESPEICESIRSAYKTIVVDSQAINNMRIKDPIHYDDMVPTNPSFFLDYEYEQNAKNGTYAVAIKQRIGKYYSFK